MNYKLNEVAFVNTRTLPAKNKALAAVCAFAYVFWCGFIFSNSLKSPEASAAQSENAENFIRRALNWFGFTKNAARTAEIAVRKAAHIFEFFLLCLLICAFLLLLRVTLRKTLISAGTAGLLIASTDAVISASK